MLSGLLQRLPHSLSLSKPRLKAKIRTLLLLLLQCPCRQSKKRVSNLFLLDHKLQSCDQRDLLLPLLLLQPLHQLHVMRHEMSSHLDEYWPGNDLVIVFTVLHSCLLMTRSPPRPATSTASGDLSAPMSTTLPTSPFGQ